jgi:hypothetical protein
MVYLELSSVFIPNARSVVNFFSYFSCIFVLYNSAFKELHFPPEKLTHTKAP